MPIDEDTAFNIRTKIDAVIRHATAARQAASEQRWDVVREQLSLAENDIGFAAEDLNA